MAVHLKKLCVGCNSISELENCHKIRLKWGEENQMTSGKVWHDTRYFPRRADELKISGSFYWIIKGRFSVRQIITDIVKAEDIHGRSLCRIFLNPCLIRVIPRPSRPFQGWRYLQPEDAPYDLGKGEDMKGQGGDMEIAHELAGLGLL